MADKQYYRDVDRKDTIVVKVPGQWSMLFFNKGDKNWRETKPDDPYERVLLWRRQLLSVFHDRGRSARAAEGMERSCDGGVRNDARSKKPSPLWGRW